MVSDPLMALLLQSALAGTAAFLGRRAKLAALALGAAAFFGVPWLAGPTPLLRGLSALAGFLGLLRIIDIVRFGGPWRAGRRLLHIVSLVDSRTLRRTPRAVDFSAFGRALLWACLAAAGFYVAHSRGRTERWGGGVVFTYAAIESGWAVTGAAYRLLGFGTPPLHVLPVASMSIGELWGTRWATPVSRWLRENCFRPLAKRKHPLLGLMLGFFASAVGHAYPVLVATDLSSAAMMFAFFIAQGMCVTVEALLGVSHWPRLARRLWTVTLMVGLSPLFVEPALRVLGGP